MKYVLFNMYGLNKAYISKSVQVQLKTYIIQTYIMQTNKQI